MKTIRTGEFPNFVYEVAYPAFEVWWKERLCASNRPNLLRRQSVYA